jgi:methylmalonic aciduria homocystinuria type C protein
VVIEQLCHALGSAGFDVVAPFSTLWYNELVAEQALPVSPLPTFGRSGGALGVLVANTRALWNVFVRDCSRRRGVPGVADAPGADLLDDYCERHVRAAASVAAGSASVSCHFVFETDAPRLVAMQRVAVLCGLCSLDSASHLCVHATYGAWLSLRAVIVLDLEPPQSRPPPAPNLVSADERAAAREAVEAAVAAAGVGSSERGGGSPGADPWRTWLRVRDAIRVGKEHRFSDDQLEYHYSAPTRRAALCRAIAALAAIAP